MILPRRRFLAGMIGLIAAPTIVKAGKALKPQMLTFNDWLDNLYPIEGVFMQDCYTDTIIRDLTSYHDRNSLR